MSFTTDDRKGDGGLRLLAQDADDLTVMSAALQDAVVKIGDMTYRPREHRFAMVLNRYRWEKGRRGGRGERVRTGLHFNGILGVRTQGVDRGDADHVLELLAIASEPGDDGAADITLLFAGGATVWLNAECVDAELTDLTAPWTARARPRHELD